jgi:hypothetical protein
LSRTCIRRDIVFRIDQRRIGVGAIADQQSHLALGQGWLGQGDKGEKE